LSSYQLYSFRDVFRNFIVKTEGVLLVKMIQQFVQIFRLMDQNCEEHRNSHNIFSYTDSTQVKISHKVLGGGLLFDSHCIFRTMTNGVIRF